MTNSLIPRINTIISLDDDLLPAGRQEMSPFHLQIGDCVFAVPPEKLSVKHVGEARRIQSLRAPGSVKSKTGYTQTEIRVKLWFNDALTVNGTSMPGPEGQYYFMDGLLALIAQFKRTPILPVFNELLNNVHAIYTVLLSNIVVSTVPDFPNALEVELVLYKTTAEPYLITPDYQFADYICWPLFRWYYQRAVAPGRPGCLEPAFNQYGQGFTGDFSFAYLSDMDHDPSLGSPADTGGQISISKDKYQITGGRAIMTSRSFGALLGLAVEWQNGTVKIGDKAFTPHKVESGTSWVFVREVGEAFGYKVNRDQATGLITLSKASGTPGATTDMSMTPLEFPTDIKLTNMVLAMSNIFADLQVQLCGTPSHQYLGGTDVQFVAVFETTSRVAVAMLEELRSRSEKYSLTQRDRHVGGYVQFNNELTRLFGVRNAMIEAVQSETVEDHPGLFRIMVSMVSYNQDQEQQEKVESINYLGKTLADIQTLRTEDMTDLYHACKADAALDALELYPDLELPSYLEVQAAIQAINAQRGAFGLAPIVHKVFRPSTYTQDDNLFVDPDFYVIYNDLGDDGIPQAPAGAGGITSQITPDPYSIAHNLAGPPRGARAYEWLDVGRPSGLTVTKLNAEITKRMSKAPSRMRGMGDAFLEAEKQTGLSALFLVSLAGYESTWGRSDIARDYNNLYGLGGGARAKNFSYKTAYEGIVSGAKVVARDFYNKGLKTPIEMNAKYEPHNSTWASTIAAIMHEMVPMDDKTAGQSSYKPPEIGAEVAKPNWYAPAGKMQIETPLPKDGKDPAGMVDPTGLSPEDIQNMMCRDMVVYSRRGRLIQAFPTFMLLFVDEGAWSGGRRLWTNFYSRHSLLNITLVRDRANPVDFLEIYLTNVYGALNHQGTPKTVGKLNFWQRMFPVITEQIVENRKKILSTLMIKAGYRVHLRMGYGSQGSQLPVAFNGVITDFNSEDVTQIICQGDGQELVDPIYKFGPESKNSVFTIGKEPRHIFENILCDRGFGWHLDFDSGSNIARTLGKDIGRNEYMFGAASPYGIEHFGLVKKQGDGLIDWWFEIDKYDVMKNVYSTLYGDSSLPLFSVEGPTAPTGLETATKNVVETLTGGWKAVKEFLSNEPNIQMWLGGKSPWDIFQICAKSTSDYIVAPHSHQFTSTLFFGKPWWPVKFAYTYRGAGGSQKREDFRELSTAFSQFHVFTSMTDILDNGIRASARRIVTNCAAIYSQGTGSSVLSPVQMADHCIKSELQRTEIIDTGTLQSTIGPDGVMAWMGYNPGEERAKLMAKNHIKDTFKEMYQGEVIVLGAPSLKPHDIFYISDHYSRIYGLASVGRVVTHLGVDTGFVTAIKPDLCTSLVDTKETGHIWAHLAGFGAWMATAIARKKFVAEAQKGRMYCLLTGRLTAALTRAGSTVVNGVNAAKEVGVLRPAIAGGRAAAGGIMAAQAATGIGLVAVAIEAAIWLALSKMFNSFVEYWESRNVIRIAPLWYKDQPFVAGISGHRNLIPGWTSEGPMTGPPPKSTDVFGPTGRRLPLASGHYPWPVDGPHGGITSNFGPRTYKDKNRVMRKDDHEGIDIGARTGVRVIAVADGIATRVDLGNKSYGKYVVIHHGDNIVTLYAHLSDWSSKVPFGLGGKVNAGDVIGYIGSTGNSTGPHLHFGIKINGKYVNPVDYLSLS